MKIYALIAVATACFLMTSCTTDDLENQNVKTNNLHNNNIESYMMKDVDETTVSTSTIDGEPVKTNGRD
jgi:uncharacterized protein YlaI